MAIGPRTRRRLTRFIHPGQMLLIWLFTSSIHRAWQFPEAPLGWLDYLAAALFFTLSSSKSFPSARRSVEAESRSP